jgi:hypothetical protein
VLQEAAQIETALAVWARKVRTEEKASIRMALEELGLERPTLARRLPGHLRSRVLLLLTKISGWTPEQYAGWIAPLVKVKTSNR